GVGVAVGEHPEWRSVVCAEKAIAHVKTRLWNEAPPIDLAVHREQNRDLDRARAMKPPVGVVMQVGARFDVMQRDADGTRAGLSRGSLDALAERVEIGWERL